MKDGRGRHDTVKSPAIMKIRNILMLALAGILLLAGIMISCSKEPGQREYERAVRELNEGNFVRARALLESSINKRPGSTENARTYNYLGIACWNLGQLAEAIDAFEDSRRLNEEFMAPVYNLGVLMYHMGEVYQASALLEEASLIDGNDPRSLEFLAYIHRRNDQWAEARRALYEALGWAPHSARILTALALVELEVDGPDAAVKYLTQALEQDPSYAPALYDLAVIHRDEREDPKQAAAFFQQYLNEEASGVYAEIARAFLQVRLPEAEDEGPAPAPAVSPRTAADETVGTAAPETPAPPAARTTEAPAVTITDEPETPAVNKPSLLEQARKEWESGHPQKALNMMLGAAEHARKRDDVKAQGRILQQTVELCFDQARAHYAYGQYLANQGQYLNALSSFKQAATLNPDWAAAQQALARSAWQAGEFDAALIALRRAINIDPQNADMLWLLAELYDRKLDFPERAVTAYAEFEQRFPSDSRVLKARNRMQELRTETTGDGQTAPETSDTAEPTPARDPAEQPARTMEPEEVPARELPMVTGRPRNKQAAIRAYNRGTTYQSREDWDRAVYYYQRAVENNNEFVQAFYNLGTVYRMMGDLDPARDAYLRAVRLQPDMVNARYNLALIYWELQQYGAAEEHAQTIISQQPDHPYAHYLLGYIYAAKENSTDLARQHFERFIALSPDDPGAASIREWLRTHNEE
jgi:tetratricopeptide (TPR) repeat protein